MLFDITHLREMTDGDAELEAELMQYFDSTIERTSQRLTHTDIAEWKSALHELRGAAMSIGAQKLGAYCQEGESHPPTEIKAQSEYRQNLATLIQQTLDALKNLLSA